MKQSPSWKANSHSDSQVIHSLLWNPKVHCCVHNSPPQVPILSQMHPIHASHPISLRSILILSSHLRLYLLTDLFPSRFPTIILYTSHLSHACYMPRTSSSEVPHYADRVSPCHILKQWNQSTRCDCKYHSEVRRYYFKSLQRNRCMGTDKTIYMSMSQNHNIGLSAGDEPFQSVPN
jgi:hypothetical protein